MEARWHSWFEAGLGFFFPNICQLCRLNRATPQEGFVCANCESGPGGVQWIVPPLCERCGLPFQGAMTGPFVCGNCRDLDLSFERARAAVAAQGVVLEVIHRYKYHRALWFEPFLARLLLERAVPILANETWDVIVPIPLHPVKKREREFNQADRLGGRLSAATGIPLDDRLLERITPTRTQTKLTREERWANVEGAFRLRSRRGLSGQRVVLVDDVLTTGATAGACAKILRQNGSGDVCVWTIARGL